MTCKKIAFVGNSAWSMVRFRREILKKFLDLGFEVYVYAPKDGTSSDLETLGCKYRTFAMSRKGLNPIAEIQTIFQLLIFYFRDRPSFIFHYTIKPNIWGSVAAKIAGIPSVAVITGLGSVFIQNSTLTSIVSLLFKLSLRYSKEVWFLNEDDRNEFVTRGIASKTNSLTIPGEGINLNEFSFQKNFPTHPTFLMIGRLLLDKGVLEFIKASTIIKKKYPKARFQLIGPLDPDNPSAISKEVLQAWITAGDIEYLGEQSDVKPFIAASTAIVLPSYREGVPRTLLEGAALGRPLIATDVPGCRELVEHGINGYLAPPRDADALADSFSQLINLSLKSIEKMGEASRQLVEQRFGINTVAKYYLKAKN